MCCDQGTAARQEIPLDAAAPTGQHDGMPIRAAATADLEAVLALAVAFYEEDGFSTTEDDLRANLSTLIGSPTARVAVSDTDGGIVAFGIKSVLARL